jgi:hypothetical protein
MGIISSRAFLFKSPEPRKSEIYPRSNFTPIAPSNRLVCDELRKEEQRRISDKKSKTCDRISLLQVTPKGIQQEDVRSLLSMEKNKVSRHGHHGRSTELF